MFNPVRSFQNLTNMNQIAISRACWDEESTACTSLAVDSCWLTATLPCYFCHLNLHTCHTSDISYFSSSAAWQQDLGTHPAPPRSAKRRWLLAFKSWEWLLCLLRPNGIAGLFQWSICICWMCVCVWLCVYVPNEWKQTVCLEAKKGLKAFRFKRNQLHYISLYTGIRLPVLKFLAVSENATVKLMFQVSLCKKLFSQRYILKFRAYVSLSHMDWRASSDLKWSAPALFGGSSPRVCTSWKGGTPDSARKLCL